MPSKESSYTKLNVPPETNDEIDAAHLRFMVETGVRLSKRDFIGAVVKLGLERETDLYARFQNRERIRA